MAILETVMAALTAISAGIAAWQHVVARRFHLHQRVTTSSGLPPVTLLKPLKGADAHTIDCLKSWLRQDYPAPVQILCGVASAQDSACQVVEMLQKLHPNRDLQLVICPARSGSNPKVSTLAQLAPAIVHPVVCISDADVWAEPDYLAQAVTTLERTDAGLVHSLYRMPSAASGPTAIEAIGTNCDMWTQVLQAQAFRKINFALGAAMTFRRDRLERIGGFAAMADYLADDNRLGGLVHATGAEIVLTSMVVECRSEPLDWRNFWQHQMRWNATIRACEPGAYLLSIIANLTVWPLAWLAVSGGSTLALAAAFGCVLIRMGTAANHWRRLLGNALPLLTLLLVPLKDLIQLIFWATAFFTHTVEWRGERFRFRKGGKLIALTTTPAVASTAGHVPGRV